jgi:hypothetical protein
MLSALVVSNHIIERANRDKIKDLTPMKLQKLLYFVFGEYLAASPDGQPLFSERFAKWKFGPVLPSVYQEFKSFGANNITSYYMNSNGEILVPNDEVESNNLFFQVFERVWEKYKNYTGVELSEITHRQDPWKNAVDNCEIRNDDIREFFQKQGVSDDR